VNLEAHSLRVTLPSGWSGHAFRRAGQLATLHAGDFNLAIPDGEFGDRSTAVMPHGGSFLALTEYLPGAGLEPGKGLFSSARIRLPLDPTSFATSALAHPRPGQAGMQHFFTAAGRPLCLYVVLAGARGTRRRQLAVLDRVLRSLHVAPRV
jgi:hypothetical protein